MFGHPSVARDLLCLVDDVLPTADDTGKCTFLLLRDDGLEEHFLPSSAPTRLPSSLLKPICLTYSISVPRMVVSGVDVAVEGRALRLDALADLSSRTSMHVHIIMR